MNEIVVKALEVLKDDFDLNIATIDHLGMLTKAAGKQKFDLCILVLNGITVPESKYETSIIPHVDLILNFVAALKAKQRIPIIALSSYVNPVLPARVRAAGVDFYFELPVESEKLKRAIQKCVKMIGKMPDEFAKRMPPLPQPDLHHLNAAQGWLELGNYLEANEELEQITPSLRSHPDVLSIRWQIYAKAGKWEMCVEIGQALVNTAPTIPDSWLHRSYALHELKRTQEAYELLEAAADLWPGNWLIHYDMACYSCQLGHQKEAWQWLEDAIDLGDPNKVKLMALDDPDLESFWAEIGEI